MALAAAEALLSSRAGGRSEDFQDDSLVINAVQAVCGPGEEGNEIKDAFHRARLRTVGELRMLLECSSYSDLVWELASQWWPSGGPNLEGRPRRACVQL